MMQKKINAIFSWPILWVIVSILVIGLVNLYSATYFWGEGDATTGLFWSQLLWTMIGIIGMVLIALIDYRLLQRFAYPLYILCCTLLLLSVIIGDAVRGTHGWLKIGPVSIQPVEFAKLSYILVSASFFSNNPNPEGYTLRDLIKPAALMLLPFGLIILQGDMGSSLFLIGIFVAMSLFAGVRRKTIIICAIIACVGAGSVFTFGLKDYQRARIFTFMHPEADIKGSGYHLMQSKIAVGSGKIFGKGYLKGNINKLRYLPERHTDFIFPVFAEEWGFAGSLILLGLYSALLFMGVETGAKSRDRFGAFIAIGITSLIFWQLLINLGGVLGLMPLTGVTLPLMSYGGSSMIAILASMGLLISIHRRRFMF